MKLVEDLGAPALVTGVDILTLEVQPDWNEWASYIMTGVGYLGGYLLPRQSSFLTKVGIASLPLTARNIYNRVKSGGGASKSAQRFALRPQTSVNRQAPAVNRMYQTEFEQAGSHAF